ERLLLTGKLLVWRKGLWRWEGWAGERPEKCDQSADLRLECLVDLAPGLFHGSKEVREAGLRLPCRGRVEAARRDAVRRRTQFIADMVQQGLGLRHRFYTQFLLQHFGKGLILPDRLCALPVEDIEPHHADQHRLAERIFAENLARKPKGVLIASLTAIPVHQLDQAAHADAAGS